MLDKLITSRCRRNILRQIIMNPDREYYGRQLSRLIGESPAAVQRELQRLEEIGLLTSVAKGNMRLYRANPSCPIYEEVHRLVVKTEGVADFLRARLKVSGDVHAALVFGSFASGNRVTADSDLDLMVIGYIDGEELLRATGELEAELAREVNYVVFEPEEFEERRDNGDRFVASVLEGPRAVLWSRSDVTV